MLDAKLTIGDLSAQTRCTVPTIRYYEQIGLIPRPGRAPNGHRLYDEKDLKRLAFIKRCRDFGFPIKQVKELVALFSDSDSACIEVRDLAQARLKEVRGKIIEMQQLEASLAAFVGSCNEVCCGGPTKDCTIIADMTTLATKPACSPSPYQAPIIDAESRSFVATELKRL
jgi:DNA-binding transcriptional MerR regulator